MREYRKAGTFRHCYPTCTCTTRSTCGLSGGSSGRVEGRPTTFALRTTSWRAFNTARMPKGSSRRMEARLAQFQLGVRTKQDETDRVRTVCGENAQTHVAGSQRPLTFWASRTTAGRRAKGHFKVKRKTSKKKYRTKLKEMKEWLRRERSRMKKGELLRQAKLKLAGHLNYYAITDNWQMCNTFRTQVHAAHVQMAESAKPETELRLGAASMMLSPG